MPLASIYPLVSTRALARPFTYEVGDAVARGDILSIRLGARAVRGVVVDVGVDPPPGVEERWITTRDNVRIHAWYVPARDARATLVWSHGNAGNIAGRVDAGAYARARRAS